MGESQTNDGDFLMACGTDAQKWAEAFCKMYPAAPDESVMVGWFANAMMVMWDESCSRITHSDEALADHISALVRNRDLWRDLSQSKVKTDD